MKKKKGLAVLAPAALALVLAAGIHVGDALAYFTTCASASGRVQIGLDFTETETGDDVRDWTKHISIENTGTSACFVRVKVLAGEKYQKYLSYTSEREGSWELREDGYWYYDAVLIPGERTGELLAALDRAQLKADVENGSQEEFNVIVVQEYTPVLYDEAGNPYADWTMEAEGADRKNAVEESEKATAGKDAASEAAENVDSAAGASGEAAEGTGGNEIAGTGAGTSGGTQDTGDAGTEDGTKEGAE